MPHDSNPLSLYEQRKKSIGFLVAVGNNNLDEVKALCDGSTLNAINAKGNTALHLAAEKGNHEILEFLIQQPGINFHQINIENKKAVDLLKDLTIVELFKKKMNESLEITKEDLLTINAEVKKAVCWGAPNWFQNQFPHQNPTEASKWEKNNPNYYRIDFLQEIFLFIKIYLEQQLKDGSFLSIVLRIFHASLAEVIQVGRCDEQVAVAFNRFLLTEKKGMLSWIQAINLEGSGGQNFIVINKSDRDCKENIIQSNILKKGLIIDPMDDRIENLEEATSELMDHLTRIISQTNATKIRLEPAIILHLPLKSKHHDLLVNFLEILKIQLQFIFENNWNAIWKDCKSRLIKEHHLSLLPLEEKTAKEWVDALWKSIERKIEMHKEMKAKLEIIEDTMLRLTQRCEVLLNAEFAQIRVCP